MAKNRPAIVPRSRSEFEKALQDFAIEVKADIEMVQREQMRLMLRDAMTFTPPMPAGGGQGLSVAAQKAGNNKLSGDVRRIFIPMDNPVRFKSVFLRKIINAVKGNDRQTFYELFTDQTKANVAKLSGVMSKIMEDTDPFRAFAKAKNYLNKSSIFSGGGSIKGMAKDLRGIHDAAKGAVGGRWPKGFRYRGPQYFAPSASELNTYIASRQRKVGFVKAGYADAMAKVPMPVNKAGVPRNYGTYNAPWVDANIAGFGTYSLHKTGKSFNMITGNNIGNINNVAVQADVKNIVYGNRVANLNSAVQARLDKAIERANRRGKK